MNSAWKKMAAAGTSLAALAVTTATAFAQASNAPNSVQLCDPLGGSGCGAGGETFQSVATNVANFLFTDIAIPLSTIMILVGAFQFMSAAGDPEKVSRGRKTIMYAAIGFGLALIASGVTKLITSILTGQ